MSCGFLWSCFSLRNSLSNFTSLVFLALVYLFCCSIIYSRQLTFLNVQISWILEPLLKVKVFLYFWYESFLATEVFTQWTWTCWMKSVVCFDKSLLIGRNALRPCKKAISLLWLTITIFWAEFLMKKTVSKSQYIYNKFH